MYRKDIKVLDCTIRDGGLINDWDFDEEMVRKVFRAVSEAGIDYMEIGYKASKKIFSPDKFGKWKFCEEDDIRRVVSEGTNTKISVMVDVDRVELSQILPKKDSIIDMIRVATYVQDVDKAIYLANHAIDKGYEATINIMAISHALEPELDEALKQIERESSVQAVYVVDSFGALYCEPIEYLVKKYRRILKTKEVGIHAHNNQQLGFANTIEGIIYNANYADASISGIGRGAGNCPMELLLAFLKNPKFDIRPIFRVIEEVFLPLREKIEWGYIIPYMITGILDEHPRAAMALRKTADKDKYCEFYEKLIT
ncbi:MAG: aldolase catalytic domain-containing protein [Candidatus Omnitrophota bacterium]